MKIKSIEKDKKILIEIPEDICKLYNLKPNLEIEIKAVDKPPSKLLISLLWNLPPD
jgi:hypothetical protein